MVVSLVRPDGQETQHPRYISQIIPGKRGTSPGRSVVMVAYRKRRCHPDIHSLRVLGQGFIAKTMVRRTAKKHKVIVDA